MSDSPNRFPAASTSLCVIATLLAVSSVFIGVNLSPINSEMVFSWSLLRVRLHASRVVKYAMAASSSSIAAGLTGSALFDRAGVMSHVASQSVAPSNNAVADSKQAASSRLPTVFLSHGGGPCFFLDAEEDNISFIKGFDKKSDVAQWYRDLTQTLGLVGDRKPKALLVISAHWEEGPQVHITAREKYPDLYFDYYGFPDKTYELKYVAELMMTVMHIGACPYPNCSTLT